MDERRKLDLIYKLTSGYSFIKQYIVDTPDQKLVNESINLFNLTMQESLFEDFIRKQDTEFILIKHRLWDFKDSNNLKELEKSLETAKLELFQSFEMPDSHVKRIRNQISVVKKRISDKLIIKHSLDRFTLNGFAEYVAELFLFSRIILNKEYKNIELDAVDLENVIFAYKQKLPSMESLREIARTEPWRSYWLANKNCFRRIGDDQRMLLLFTKMYENVFEHSDRPSDEIIADDDALDGWFLFMRNKAEQERRESGKAIIERRHGNAGEIFILANTDKDAEDITNMNDARGKIIKKRIEQKIQQKGTVQHLDIPEFRIEAYNNG